MENFIINRRYRIDREIGAGGMATVYLGHDLLLDRTIAVKRLHTAFASDTAFRVRFEREAQAAASLAHPHIVDIFDVGEYEDQPYIVMEYLSGQSLKSIIEQEGPFHPDEVAALIEQVATALDHAHDRGIVHRDVKPQNILVDADGIAKIVDFGIAKGLEDGSLTGLGSSLGTAGYIAPEQALGQPATPTSDVYSLGVVALEMLTKCLPFQADNAVAVALQHIQSEPPVPSKLIGTVPRELDRIILKAMAKEPSQRYRSAGLFAESLTDWRSSHPRLEPPLRHEQTQVLPAAKPDTLSPIAAPSRAAPAQVAAAAQVVSPTEAQSAPHRQSWLSSHIGSWVIGLVGLGTVLALIFGAMRFSPLLSAMFEESPPTAPSSTSTVVSNSEESASAGSDGADTASEAIPDLTGLSLEDATTLLSGRGLALREDPAIFSSAVREGAIAEQDPPPGTALASGDTVFVKASRGPAQMDLTELAFTGQPAGTVQQRLAELGLNVRQEERGSQTVPVGRVVELVPQEDVSVGDTVTLVVSLGDQVQIPRETFGAPVSEAANALQALGFVLDDPIGVDRTTIERQINLTELGIQSGDVVGVQNEDGSASFGAWLERSSSMTLVYYDSSLDASND